MEIITAKTAGFCFGVKKAVEKVYEQTDRGKQIYTYGPIIHNEQVVADLENRGVRVIRSPEELEELSEGTVIIRSHGVSREIQDRIRSRGLECIDATCPFVKKIHNIVQRAGEEGKKIVIIGNDGHPEVEGIKGWCVTPVSVVGAPEDANMYSAQPGERLCIVSQTTFNYKKFQELVEIFYKRGYSIDVVNTICGATEERQTEARQIAKEAEAMIVIGGTHSSNTRKLYEICKEECRNTLYIQTLDGLKAGLPESIRCVGITAGASTPNNIIEEVQNYVRANF